MADANEPAVKQEDFLSLLKAYTPPQKNARARDMLSDRYRILLDKPLPDLSSPLTKAYAVRDEKEPKAELYALVFESNIPLRQKNITALKTFRHANIVSLLEDGVAEISTLSEARYVAILEKPIGQKLSRLLAQGRSPISESMIIDYLLRPLNEVLAAFNSMGISHNRINLDNVYLSHNNIMLGECISEPSGFSQPPVFEPIDRILTSAWGKADFSIGADCYALTMTALHLALGFQPFAQMDKESLIAEILTKGSYHALAMQWDMPDDLQDFFRGMLNDNRRDRWDPQNIKNWLSGRKFNLIAPSAPQEASRGFEFAGQTYFSPRILAHAISTHSAEARALLFDTSLSEWLDAALHKSELAETIGRLAVGNSSDNPRAERQNNEQIARIIIILDPHGPIRFKHISVTPEGIALSLAHAVLAKQTDDIQALSQIIESDLISFWIDQQKITADYTALNWKLQKIRGLMRMTSIGFGMERCLYELYPSLSCQSPVVARYYAAELGDLLFALDAAAPEKFTREDCMDRHIAAFLASKLEIAKELRASELEAIPALAANLKFAAFKLLIRAQNKVKDPSLKGLSIWAASWMMPQLDNIHKRSQRRELQTKLLGSAKQGSLTGLGNILLNADIFITDKEGFQKAKENYALRKAQIAEIRNDAYIARHARMLGRGIAQTLACGICCVMIYYTLKSYFHF